MMRKSTRQSRGRNAEETRFQNWVASQPCIQCGRPQVVVDHCKGSAFKHNKILIGHWFVIPLCPICDEVKTQGSHRRYQETFGESQAKSWMRLIQESPIMPPDDVFMAIKNLSERG